MRSAAVGKSFLKPRHIAPSDQTGSETKNHTSQALKLAAGSCAAWKPLTRASDHALKLPVSPQVAPS